MSDALTEICPHCDGKCREWHMQGGPHGIGRMGKCHFCKGEGRVTAAKYQWHQLAEKARPE